MKMPWNMKKEPILQMGPIKWSQDMHLTIQWHFLTEGNGKTIRSDRYGGLIWYTDDFKTNYSSTSAVMRDVIHKEKAYCISLRQYTSVFQAEVCAIKACTVKNINR
jgi:hypothetical protein